MPIPVLLAISISVALVSGILRKHYSKTFPENRVANQGLNLVVSLVATIVLICWGGFSGWSWFTCLLALGFGIITGIQQVSNLKAMDFGPWSYTSVLISLSTLIPALSGVFIWGEDLHWAQVVGMVLMVGCFICSVESKADEKGASKKWILWCMIAFLCTGMIGIMQKWHQTSNFKGELNTFLILAFFVSCIYSSIFMFKIYRESKSSLDCFKEKEPKHLIWIVISMIMMGGAVAINNKLNLYLSGVMDSAVFFPLVNGGGLILTTLAAVVLFKEKLSVKQWIGLIIGMVAVVFLCNPFV